MLLSVPRTRVPFPWGTLGAADDGREVLQAVGARVPVADVVGRDDPDGVDVDPEAVGRGGETVGSGRLP